jgi:transglutaminase-like putative cysteine protease
MRGGWVQGVASLMFLTAWSAHASAPPFPDWVQQAAASQATNPAGAKAVVLFEDELLTVQPDGQMRLRRREVIKVLRPQGREYTTLVAWSGMGRKLLSFHAWSIGPDGHQYTVKDDQIREEGGEEGGMLYVDDRAKVATPPGADPGGVVAYESESQLPGYMTESTWDFQTSIPVRRAVFEVDLPAGWKQRALWHRHDPVQPQEIAPNHWRWELADLPAVDLEDVPLAPAEVAIAGRMVVHYAANDIAQGDQLWTSIGNWYEGLGAPQTLATNEISAKALELASKEGDFTARVEKIAEFMQREIRYVGIEIGIGGYQPHAAAAVFHNRYGDCKDKATLLIAMLNSIGVHATYVLVDTRRGFVDADVPSIDGNHAIAAIEVPAGYNDARLKTIVKTRNGQRFLIFDPTNQYVPLGLLPTYLQGSYGTLVNGANSQVIELPVVSPDADVTERIAKFELNADGTLEGSVTEERVGASSGGERHYFASNADKERREYVERRLRQDFSAFQLTTESAENVQNLEEKFVLKYQISAPAYAKTAGNLLLVRPRVLGSDAEALSDRPRKYPIDLEAEGTWRDSFDVTVPAGFTVDELPDPTKVDVGFATYRSEVKADRNVLRYSRELVVKELALKPDQYDALQKLESAITTDENRSAVLKKQ